jgi:hypothetical protein
MPVKGGAGIELPARRRRCQQGKLRGRARHRQGGGVPGLAARQLLPPRLRIEPE